MTSFRSSDSEDTTKKCVCDKDSSQVEYLEHVHSPDAEGACLLDDSIENTVVGRVAWLITFALSTGGFLFGVISAVLVTVSDSLSPGRNLSSSESELITSITSAGAFVGAIAAGLCADAYGRKLGIYVGCVFFFIGSILQATSWSIAQMVIGRFVVGVGVGEAAMVVPLYIGELAPAKVRGKMIAFDNMSVTLGQLVSYALGAGFTHVGAGWRYMVGLGAVPAIILAATLPLCPESPRQLVAKGKLSEAGAALRKVFPEATDAQVAGKIAVIQGGMKKEQGDGRGLWWQYKQLHCVAGNLRALIAACTVMASKLTALLVSQRLHLLTGRKQFLNLEDSIL
ncbi:hypothetical protein FH972_024933 [Carpinus fangiana]|uniref:Major facilitator superfamily (MFS) profile domain-containing protein n=1 Tax=Carpinus fangiana TaxID=176857 RepID=A0A5N6KZX8_9ROSI|nr:hypothetical protein FH972_024933 [Carpinus fangiana]